MVGLNLLLNLNFLMCIGIFSMLFMLVVVLMWICELSLDCEL